MATNKQIGSGTTIDVQFPLPVNISELYNVEVELYTDPNRPVKFSYIEKDGFYKLETNEAGSAVIWKLLSKETVKMRGCLMMRMTIFADNDHESENVGRSVPTDTTITFF